MAYIDVDSFNTCVEDFQHHYMPLRRILTTFLASEFGDMWKSYMNLFNLN